MAERSRSQGIEWVKDYNFTAGTSTHRSVTSFRLPFDAAQGPRLTTSFRLNDLISTFNELVYLQSVFIILQPAFRLRSTTSFLGLKAFTYKEVDSIAFAGKGDIQSSENILFRK